MTLTVTKAALEKLADNCNREAPVKGWKYTIEYAYGRPRLILEDSRRCCRGVSPRLPKGKLENDLILSTEPLEAKLAEALKESEGL